MNRSSFLNSNNNIMTPQKIGDAFKMFCIDQKFLSLQRFNDALEYLFKPPIPVIHHTFLSQKLFNIIDHNKTGNVDENSFCEIFTNILKDRTYRLRLSMEAMMAFPDKNREYLEVNEIKKFMYNSYIEGFKILSNLVDLNKDELKRQNLPIVNANQLTHWANNQELKLYKEIDNDLNMLNSNIVNQVSYSDFMKWISIDHCFYIQYGFISLPVATNLLVLDKIVFNDSGLNKMMPDNINNMNANNKGNININNSYDKKKDNDKNKENDFGFLVMSTADFM